MRVTYMPASGDADTVEVFGTFFVADEPVEIADDKLLNKLKGNRFFRVGSEKPKAESEGPTEDDKRLAKAVDGRSKAARDARAKADEANQDAAAKERAAAQVRAIAEAREVADKGE